MSPALEEGDALLVTEASGHCPGRVQVLRVNNRVIPLQSDALVVDIRRLEPDCRSLRQGRDPRSEPLGWLWLGSCWLATFRLAFWLPL